MNVKIILFMLYCFVCFTQAEKIAENSSDDEEFIPTNEWKVIKKGQAIPQGLHIRINLQTGLKEAKLLNNEKTQTSLLKIKQTDNEDDETNSENQDYLKEMLKNIKNEDISSHKAKNPQQLKTKFRSYQELKKDLENLNIRVKSDVEVIEELLSNYDQILSNRAEENEILYILKSLEYLVHQIDNANHFIKLNGLNKIVFSNLNNTSVKIRSEALNVLGSCVQNNAKAQIKVFEAGAIEKILRLFALETNNNVKMKAIYSLSSLIRRFPIAQSDFINNNGLYILAKSFSNPNNVRLQLKVITLLYDLLKEEKDALEYSTSENYQARVKQYKLVGLQNKLIQNGWCNIFNDALINNFQIEQTDHDAIERCLNIISLVIHKCLDSFRNNKLQTVLRDLHANYINLSSEELTDESDESSYFTNLKNLTFAILNILYITEKSEL